MSSVKLESVVLVAKDQTHLLDDVSIDVRQGELLVVIGPSGSGKTSIIRVVAGLERVTSGRVLFDEDDFTDLPVGERDVGVVFQSAALFPTHTARGNIGFPLRIRKLKAPAIRERVEAEARALGIAEIMERWPLQLSAGHQQLVQIARAMVRVPRVLLLDEPLAHVDPPTRRRLRSDLRQLQQGYGVTTILATNDPEEAMVMADRIVAIENGRIQQVGPPQELYASPADTHIAWLTGPIGLRPESIRVAPDSPTRAVVVGNSFDSGRSVTKVSTGDATIAMKALDDAAGTEIGIAIDRYLVFGPDDRLVLVAG